MKHVFCSRFIGCVSPLFFFCLSLLLTTQCYAVEYEFRFQQWQDSEFSTSPVEDDDSTIDRREFFLAASERWQEFGLEASYAHRPFLIRSGEPAHNGYFHQFDVALDTRFNNATLEAALGLHGTSNMFKEFDFHREAFVVSFGVRQGFPEYYVEGIGLQGDYRFGPFTLYPRLRIEYPLSAQLELIVDAPVELILRSTSGWRIGIERFGEKWATLDAEREIKSALYLSEWRAGAWITMPPVLTSIDFELSAGVSFDSEVRYLDLVEGTLKESVDPALYVGLAARF